MNSKYNTFRELYDAFKSGELSKRDWQLVCDNDSSYLNWIGEDDGEDMYPVSQKIWCGKYIDVLDVLEVLGIPATGP